MQIKRYEVLDIKDAIEMIKRDLGEDAVIISTRQVNNSSELGFFGKPFLEVVAAVDYNEEELKPASEESKNNTYDILHPLYDDIKFLKDNFESIVEDKVIETVSRKYEEINSALEEIKFNIGLLKENRGGNYEKEHDLLMYLDTLSFDRKTGRRLIEVFFKNIKLSNFKREEKIEYFKKFFKKLIEKKISRKKINISADGKSVIVLVGTSGSGKTSTAAKICANLMFEKNAHISLCSIDSAKLGGYDALKSYSKKLKIDFSAVRTPAELRDFVSSSNSDVVIVDTFAVNHNDIYRLNNLAKFIGVFDGKAKLELLLPAQTKSSDAVRIYESFRNKTGVNSIIISKTDESKFIGNLTEILLFSDSTIDYLTFGESVPEDLEEATPDKVFSLFFPVSKF